LRLGQTFKQPELWILQLKTNLFLFEAAKPSGFIYTKGWAPDVPMKYLWTWLLSLCSHHSSQLKLCKSNLRKVRVSLTFNTWGLEAFDDHKDKPSFF
jgi:hypothetical protein